MTRTLQIIQPFKTKLSLVLSFFFTSLIRNVGRALISKTPFLILRTTLVSINRLTLILGVLFEVYFGSPLSQFRNHKVSNNIRKLINENFQAYWETKNGRDKRFFALINCAYTLVYLLQLFLLEVKKNK